ncbi:MAG TPA: hypothetical protein VKE74_10130, partial [Gemmataceae bacterium]|nr:hypothetical protein [Gemmataceae bacterium]
AGCQAPAPCRAAPAQPAAAVPELPITKPVLPAFNLGNLPKAPVRFVAGFEPGTYRELTAPLCQSLAARNASAANTLADEDRLPGPASGCDAEADQLRRAVRYFTALEFRNQAAAAALERYYQLTGAESRSAIAREAGPILEDVFEKADKAKRENIRYPLDPADIERQRGQLASQLEEAAVAVRAVNIDLRRRLGLTPGSADDRLWPVGSFDIDPQPADPVTAVNAALADRPELRAWRTLQQGLTVNTLPVARDLLRGGAPLAAGVSAPMGGPLARCVTKLLASHSKPDPCAAAELEVRRKQLADVIASRERDVADETRVAVAALNGQTRRVALARDRVDGWQAKLDDAVRLRKAGLPMADLLEAQARLEWLKARSELVAEVMAWHQARVRLRAAMGWLVWETLSEPGERRP